MSYLQGPISHCFNIFTTRFLILIFICCISLGCARFGLWHMESSIVFAACGIFSFNLQTLSCSIWDLALWPGMERGPSA